MGKSRIEWTEATWNPIVGCSIATPGCTNCYAMKMASRIEAMNAGLRDGHGAAPHYAGTTQKVKGRAVWTGKLALAPNDTLLAPLRRKKPTIYFVNSMGDLFHEDAPDHWIDLVFAVMALSPQHTFQVLTKRAERMHQYVMLADHRIYQYHAVRYWVGGECRLTGEAFPFRMEQLRRFQWPLPNVWLGASAERQHEANERVPELLRTPAALRFISAEPLLGPIDLRALSLDGVISPLDALKHGATYTLQRDGRRFYHAENQPTLDWVIVGGESGKGARPMHPDWALSLRDQCAAAGVKFFFKQWGEWAPTHPNWPKCDKHAVANDGTVYRHADIAYPAGPRLGEAIRAGHDKANLTAMYQVGKAKAGRALDGVTHDGMPEVRA
jgi:protein gp37